MLGNEGSGCILFSNDISFSQIKIMYKKSCLHSGPVQQEGSNTPWGRVQFDTITVHSSVTKQIMAIISLLEKSFMCSEWLMCRPASSDAYSKRWGNALLACYDFRRDCLELDWLWNVRNNVTACNLWCCNDGGDREKGGGMVHMPGGCR